MGEELHNWCESCVALDSLNRWQNVVAASALLKISIHLSFCHKHAKYCFVGGSFMGLQMPEERWQLLCLVPQPHRRALRVWLWGLVFPGDILTGLALTEEKEWRSKKEWSERLLLAVSPLAKLGSQLCCKGGLPTYGSLKTAVVPVVVHGTKARPVGLLRCTDSKIFFFSHFLIARIWATVGCFVTFFRVTFKG